jgi:hypothetical protein
MAEGKDVTIYFGGAFANFGGLAVARICSYNPGTKVISAMGAGANGQDATSSSAIASLSSRIDGLTLSQIFDETQGESAKDSIDDVQGKADDLELSALQPRVIEASTTATANRIHIVVATATLTDPSPPAEGMFYEVFVRNGTATVGGTPYSTAGDRLVRVWHSGSWTTYRYPAA